VNDIIMPPVGVLTGGVDFAALKIVLRSGDAAHKVAEVAISYGTFINTIIQFLIIAAAIFIVVRMIKRLEPPPAPAETPLPTPSEALLTQIRDLLANRS
jgi:large conductance mechanosensitive channel